MIQGKIMIKTNRLLEPACIGVRKVGGNNWGPIYSKKYTYLHEILKSLKGVKNIGYEEQGEYTIIRYSN